MAGLSINMNTLTKDAAVAPVGRCVLFIIINFYHFVLQGFLEWRMMCDILFAFFCIDKFKKIFPN